MGDNSSTSTAQQGTATTNARRSAKVRLSKPWSRHSPEGPWDDLVIGSGMGGMTAAAILSETGRRVLVLEQHYVPGGFTHAFPRKGYVWDVGVHAIGDVTEHSLTGRLLRSLSRGRLKWASLGPVYDEFFFPDGLHIEFPDTPQQFRANLVAAFPDEAEAIDRYLQLVREVAATIKGYFVSRAVPRRLVPPVQWLLARKAQGFLDKTVEEVVTGLTDNPKLRTLLTAQWGYYGTVPSRASFAVQAMVSRHYAHGGYYPVGGSPNIARCLLGTVAENGGWTRILADVEQILIDKGKAVGVRLVGGEEIRAKRVISAVGVGATVNRLLPTSEAQQAWAVEASQLTPGPAHVCLYLGFKGDIRQAGASAANKWFYQTWSSEDDIWHVQPGGPMGKAPILYCSFPSLKDPEHDPGDEQRHTGEVITFVPWEDFASWQGSQWKHRGIAYESFKDELQEALLQQFLQHMPELEPLIDYVELSTPASTDHFVRPQAGSIYGLEPTPERFRSRSLEPRSPIPNLYFAGSEVGMVGVMGAMLGGLLGAAAASPVGVIRYLRKL